MISTSIARRIRVANTPARRGREHNPGGLLISLGLLALAGVGAVVVWKHFADDNSGMPAARAMTGRVGIFAWEIEREVQTIPYEAPWYAYHWRIYEGNQLIANGDSFERDDQLAYEQAKNQVDATIAKHGGMP